MIYFQEFPKMSRLSRDMVITEKIDGTNAQVIIDEEGNFGTGSRTKLITPEDDNAGFARWAMANKAELLKLGPGRHFGEWWGSGVQRGYGLKNGDKRFSLFNVGRWNAENIPACCSVVPTLYRGPFDTAVVTLVLEGLGKSGSLAAPGFMKPEGVVVFHTAGGYIFKKTFEKDEAGKGQVQNIHMAG